MKYAGKWEPNGRKDAVKDKVADPDYVTALSSLQQSITTACPDKERLYAYE
jgi:hypothetical protein